MKTWKHYLAITAVVTTLMGGAAFAQQAPQNAPWLYGQDQQQVQPVQRGQDDHNRQQSGINQLSGKQQSKDTKNQKNLKKETAQKTDGDKRQNKRYTENQKYKRNRLSLSAESSPDIPQLCTGLQPLIPCMTPLFCKGLKFGSLQNGGLLLN